MGALQQCPFQRCFQDARPSYRAAGFSFLDEPSQEERSVVGSCPLIAIFGQVVVLVSLVIFGASSGLIYK